MSEILRRFNGDEHTKQALKEYLLTFFKEKIIEKALKQEDVKALAEACIELENGFNQIEIDYGIKQQQKPPTNGAR